MWASHLAPRVSQRIVSPATASPCSADTVQQCWMNKSKGSVKPSHLPDHEKQLTCSGLHSKSTISKNECGSSPLTLVLKLGCQNWYWDVEPSRGMNASLATLTSSWKNGQISRNHVDCSLSFFFSTHTCSPLSVYSPL